MSQVEQLEQPPDLWSICSELMQKEAQNRLLRPAAESDYSLKRPLLNLTYAAVGRGGECRLLHYNDWNVDPVLDVLICKWRELKTFKQYYICFFPYP